jgi:hypothetical protein
VYGTIDEFHNAVVAQEEIVRNVADSWASCVRVSSHCEYQLMLGWCDAGGFGLGLAPAHEPSELSAELEQTAVIALTQWHY